MKIKSLLLGSAAALAAVSGARAADAVMMAAPEPVEYVRVCDAYGTGFFYIPGTETCLRFDGYMRYQIGAQDDGYFLTYNPGTYSPAGALIIPPGYYPQQRSDGWTKTVRARFNVDARSDTEWGTLRGYMRLQGTWGGLASDQDGNVSVDRSARWFLRRLHGIRICCSVGRSGHRPFRYPSHG
jgi:hypothetical protein